MNKKLCVKKITVNIEYSEHNLDENIIVYKPKTFYIAACDEDNRFPLLNVNCFPFETTEDKMKEKILEFIVTHADELFDFSNAEIKNVMQIKEIK